MSTEQHSAAADDTAPSGSDYLRDYFKQTKGKIFLACIRNSDSKLPPGQIAEQVTRSIPEIDQFIAKYDKPETETAIYYCTATLRDGRNRRIAENCWQFPSLFADIDDKKNDLSHGQVIALLDALPYPPTFIIVSGHGLQPHWLTDSPSEDAERFIALRRKLQGILASDSVPDAPRLMRLPGSHNSKFGDWLPVESHTGKRYALDELDAWLKVATEIIRHKVPPKTSGAARPASEQFYSDGDDDRIRDALPYIDAADRDVWLKVGMALKTHLGESGRPLWDQWSASCAEKFNDRDQDKTWRSFRRDGISIGTLFHHAKQGGWQSTNGRQKSDQRLPVRTRTPESLPSDEHSGGSAPTLISVCASSVKMTAVTWLWNNRFALGKVSLIAGLPDEGKGQLLSYTAAQVTTAGPWPCDEGRAPQGRVVILTDEDDHEDTVVPRLAAAGADLDQIEIIKMVRGDKDRMFSLITDLELLRRKIIELGNVRMVQIDPVTAYLGIGKIDSFRTTDVRAVLTPLANLAADLHVAVIAVMHFNKKVDVTNALLRISDSVAFGAIARSVYGVIDDAEHERKLLVRAKNNLAAASQNKTLAFRFTAREVGVDQETGNPIAAPYIVFDPQYVDVTATEAMQAAADSKSPAVRDEAKKFLADMLAAGPALKAEIEEAAEANGIAERTLRRAKSDLKVTAKKDGEGGKWRWHMPDPKQSYFTKED
jgi:hypothetical protein